MTRRGFTLIEVMVAMVILSIVLLGLGRFVASFTRAVGTSNVRTTATEVARSRIELARAEPRYDSLVPKYGPPSAGADSTGFFGYPFMRRRTVVVRDQSGTPARDFTRVTVVVTDPSLRDTVSLSTVVARP